MVPRGMAHLLEVVVLPARPHALLARHRPGVRPPLEPLKYSLELHHPGVGEEECGVVAGTRGELGTSWCPRALKNSRNWRRISAEVMGGI